MGIRSLFNIFRRKNEDESIEAISFDYEDINDSMQKTYLKRIALDTCANFIARAVAQSEIRINDSDWYYKLNVRPNTDMSADQFWQKLIYQLIVDNEVLVVLSNTNDLLIADNWIRKEYALYDDVFERVTVKGYTFSKSFRMSEVLYFEYNNDKLSRFVNGLFEDYSELYGKLLEAVKRNNQIRGTIEVEGNSGLDETTRTALQEYVDKLFTAFKERSVAIAPLLKGFSYKEHSNTTGTSNISPDQVTKIINDLIDIVADALGIPTALLHGTRAELKDNMLAFNKYCLAPLLKKIEAELNAKLTHPLKYKKEDRIEVVGINKPDIFELATSIDKLISSSAFNPDEVRRELGYDPRPGGDKYLITKNLGLAEAENMKGGEE